MRVTGSKVHRVWKCQASAVLPQSGLYQPELDKYRDRGKVIHRFLERVQADGRDRALAEVPKDLLPLCEALALDDLPVGLTTEVSFAWNWQAGTVRELGRNLPQREDGGGVDYDSVQPPVDWSREIPATLDVVGVQRWPNEMRFRGYCGDYKSGHAKYPAPDMYGQTLLGALCVVTAYGCDDCVVELLHIHDNGGHHTVRRIVNTWDLDVFAQELRYAMEVVEDRVEYMHGHGRLASSETPVPVEGPWCEYCPAFKACPAKIALVHAIPQELVQLGVRPDPESGALQLTPGALTVRNAGLAWMAIERIEDILARAKEEICSIGWHEDIPLSEGRVVGRLVTERRSANGRVAADLLEERYGRAEREERVDLSVTLSALRQAVVKHLKPGEKIETRAKTGVYDKLLADLERLGGLEVKVTDAVRPHVPKKK